MKELLKALSECTGPSGWEDAVRKSIAGRTMAMGLRTETDALGNLMIWKSGAKRLPRPAVISAYMDEPGMMIKDVTEEGFLKFGLTGHTDVRAILGKTVLVGEQELPAVVGLKPIHLTPPEERKNMPETEDLYLDLGAPDMDWVSASVSKGDYAVFAMQTLELGRYEILSKAMGRSVGCAVVLELMKRELPVDVCFVLTVQRHVGARGAYGAAAKLQAERVIVLDICPGGTAGEKLPRLGAGPVIPMADQCAIYHRDMIGCLRQGAERSQTEIQLCADSQVSGDGGVWQRAASGARTAALYCPAKYITAPAQVIDSRDLAAMPGVLLHMLEVLTETETEVC